MEIIEGPRVEVTAAREATRLNQARLASADGSLARRGVHIRSRIFKHECLRRLPSEYQHLIWAQRQGSHRPRVNEVNVADD